MDHYHKFDSSNGSSGGFFRLRLKYCKRGGYRSGISLQLWREIYRAALVMESLGLFNFLFGYIGF
ncbi:hypothetical protein Hanom_Chr00s004049g01718731 [Helianthus anomalus]